MASFTSRSTRPGLCIALRRAAAGALATLAPLLAGVACAATAAVAVYPPQPTDADTVFVRVFVPGDPRVNTHTVSTTGKNVAITLVQDGANFGSPHGFVFWEPLGVLAAGKYDVNVRRVIPSRLDEDVSFKITVTAAAAPASIPTVEFYNAALDHYFLSANVAEIADLDAGRHPGWVRTGGTFKVYDGPATNARAVCRFYITPAFGDSHFFSANRDECASLDLENYDRAILGDLSEPRYLDETAAAFYVLLPDLVTGICPANSQPVYRLWNGRADSGHRFTTSGGTRAEMVAAGFISEGYGPLGVAMCAPLH